jgi:hypothetical protein
MRDCALPCPSGTHPISLSLEPGDGRGGNGPNLPGGGHLAAPGTFPTKAEANRWLATVEADRARGLWVDPRAGRMRLEEYAVNGQWVLPGDGQ